MNALDRSRDDSGGGEDPEIVLISLDDAYYLLEGVEFLNQMMLVDGIFPKPVGCIRFETIFDLKDYFEGPTNLVDLWGINPKIVDRLRRDGCLLEIDAQQG